MTTPPARPSRLRVRLGLAVGALLVGAGWIGSAPAGAADLAGRDLVPPRFVAPRPAMRAVEEPFYLPDRRPASSNGYYGYYGYDITGVPYEGLYSADVTCLRSVRTPEGYRTVDVCRR